jgi:BirA family biotin operon repressor/biotin-[acetyl-CoA-carboxylase] ligase
LAAVDVLSFLASGEWVSGEEMARSLAVSRAAVWKQVQALRKKGYEISSSTRKGYRLARKPDFLDADRIKSILNTGWLGSELSVLREVSSTNAVALSKVHDSKNGTVILAETQTEGRGRLSRPWVSPPGGIWMSLILKPNMPLSQVYRINMALAVALCKTVSSLYGLPAVIKWPNDLLIGEKKFCGILMEVGAQVDRLDYVVVGLGLNVNNDTSTFPFGWRSTSLSAELGREIDRNELIARILGETEAAIEEVDSPRIYEEWRSRSTTLKRQVRISSAAGDLEGEVVDLDEDGALILRQGDIMKRILAGDCIHLLSLEAKARQA